MGFDPLPIFLTPPANTGAEPAGVRRPAMRRVSRRGPVALLAMLTPAILFPILLILARTSPRYGWVMHLAEYPWQLWLLAVCGSIATAGGLMDWFFHRSGETAIGKAEHQSHVAALAGGGVPLFALMAVASVLSRPQVLLLPIILIAGGTTVLICYDEFVFHRRRCDGFETLTHRLLTFGNGVAWLAWMHWVFVRPI